MGWGGRVWEGTWGPLDTPVRAWGLLGRLDCAGLGKVKVEEGRRRSKKVEEGRLLEVKVGRGR
jgi:hypothetical protein